MLDINFIHNEYGEMYSLAYLCLINIHVDIIPKGLGAVELSVLLKLTLGEVDAENDPLATDCRTNPAGCRSTSPASTLEPLTLSFHRIPMTAGIDLFSLDVLKRQLFYPWIQP